jgi:hypothetical protein
MDPADAAMPMEPLPRAIDAAWRRTTSAAASC